MQSWNQTLTHKQISWEKKPFMKQPSCQFGIPCKSSYDTVDLQMETQTLWLKIALKKDSY